MNCPLSNAEKENAPAATASEAHEENQMTNCETTKPESAGCASLPIEFSIFPDTKAAEIKARRATWGELVAVRRFGAPCGNGSRAVPFRRTRSLLPT